MRTPEIKLVSVNDTFQPRLIPLPQNEVVKIERYTGTTPMSDCNAVFDSKTLSREHAHIWAEGGKVGVIPSLRRVVV